MRFLFSSTRGSGHLQPLLPYAHALLKQGHDVLVAGPAEVGAPLRDAGLAHAPFAHPGDDALAPIWARLRTAAPGSSEAMAIAVGEIFAGANARAALPKLQETIGAWRPDVIVRDSVEFGSAVAAEVAGLPHACVQVHVGFVEEGMLPVATPAVDALRRSAGLAPDGGASLAAERVFTAFPASLDDPAAGGQRRNPFRIRASDEQPNATIPAWASADDGRPVIYITFGTIAGGVKEARTVYRGALAAVAELPVRALLTTGPGLEGDALGVVPANVHVEAWVPQRDVLPHVAALLCHGGSGTILGALAAGLPLVVVPLFADQPDNARRIAAAGAGIALAAPDAATMRAAVELVLADDDLRRGARRIAAEMAKLPTVDRAVDELVALARR